MEVDLTDATIIDTCCDIVKCVRESELDTLDIMMHLYYTLLWEIKEYELTRFVGDGKSRQEKDKLRGKIRDYDHYLPNEDKYSPFVLDTVRGKKNNDPNMIRDFMPNMIRFYYKSSDFRKLFTKPSCDKTAQKRYACASILNIIKQYMDYESAMQENMIPLEECWFLERILGFNVSISLYSFFSNIFKNDSLSQDDEVLMQSIIKQIVSYPGIYSKCEMVEMMKCVYLLLESEAKKTKQEILKQIESTLKETCQKLGREYTEDEQFQLNEIKDNGLEKKDYQSMEEDLRKHYETVIDGGIYQNCIIKENCDTLGQLLHTKNNKLYYKIQQMVIEEIHMIK